MLTLANHEISRFPSKERPHMPVSTTTPGRLGARTIAPIRVAFRRTGKGRFRNSRDIPGRKPEYTNRTRDVLDRFALLGISQGFDRAQLRQIVEFEIGMGGMALP